MAMMVDQQQQSHKHHCRICKKGFGCGRALGGHMRAHGINDDAVGEQGDGADDDPPSACGSEWDDKLSPSAGGTRRMYSLRTNPHRLRTCRACENCGKEFSSWKAFLEHGRCASAGEVDPGDESMVSSPRSDGGGGAEDDVDSGERRGCMGWSKGKRSRRTSKVPAGAASSSYCLSSQEEDLANCLVMLSAGRVEPMTAVETEESCASASKEEDRRVERTAALHAVEKPKASAAAAPLRGMFECKACKKVFSSHQALGGHRASHKKVKGCFAARLDDLDESPAEEEVITRDHAAASAGMAYEAGPLAIVPFDQAGGGTPLKKKSKLHECSICHRVFTSGQALGGHKRCHWITSNAGAPDPASMAKLHQMQAQAQHQQQLLQLRPMLDKSEPLDLNLPAPADDVAGSRPELEVPLSLDVPAALFLQHAWTDNTKQHNSTKNNTNSNTIYNNNHSNKNTCNLDDVDDDEADSKIKLAKLSDLKDLNMGGDSSSWLQVGIGSSTKTGREP
ncbi:hypothetical protein Taro_006352 [Colocasia esculenta]|uniref:C2H2-type domain-containing protein n=1 Tax=Colocasia esculenta TaxID=4460 RepID=A0A843TXD8_COLES|nr:hypothetical protein [Colocasia esculenta]